MSLLVGGWHALKCCLQLVMLWHHRSAVLVRRAEEAGVLKHQRVLTFTTPSFHCEALDSCASQCSWMLASASWDDLTLAALN
jgi:hypothetical protein